MDPLSDVLSLLELKTYVAGGFGIEAAQGIRFAAFNGMKCYAVVSGGLCISVEGLKETVVLSTGDCMLLPRGLPFLLTTDLAAACIDFSPELTKRDPADPSFAASVLGGHVIFNGSDSDFLLQALPPLVVLRGEAHKRIMRASLDCLREELRNQQAGSSIIAKQFASIMLVQALRSHLEVEQSGATGWIFALSDPPMRNSLTYIHANPRHAWTVEELASRVGMSRTIFAQRFKDRVGVTPMEYLNRWRMLLASDRLKSRQGTISQIASAVGYETESAFSRAFKRAWGHTPREHAKAHGPSERSDLHH